MEPIQQVLILVEGTIEKEVSLVQQTGGVSPIDLEEILRWARAFQVPPDGRFDLLNLFFHHLPGGSFAVGRLSPVIRLPEGESSATYRRIDSFYIQIMVVDPETFLSFGNNPVYLYQKVLETGDFPFVTRQVPELRAINVMGEGRWLDSNLLRGMAISPGIPAISALLESLLDFPCVIFTGGAPAIHAISALFNLLPVDCRTELTFSTGLHFSPDHYLRLIGVSRKNPLLAEIRARYPVPFLDLKSLAEEPRPLRDESDWARLASRVLRTRRTGFFHRKLSEYHLQIVQEEKEGTPFFPPSTEELNRLGRMWLEELRRLSSRSGGHSEKPTKTPPSSRGKRSGGPQRDVPTDSPSESSPDVFPQKAPKSIPERLRRWFQKRDPDEAILYFQEEQSDGFGDSPASTIPPPFLSDRFREWKSPSSGEGMFQDQREGSTDDNRGENLGGGDSSKPSPPPFPPSGNHPRLESRLPTPNRPLGQIPFEEPLLIYGEKNRLFSPFQQLLAEWPEREESLLELDSLIAHALSGDYWSSESLSRYWNEVGERYDDDFCWAIREEYIHFIQALLAYNEGENGIQSPKKSLAALEVLDLFLNEQV